MCNSWRRPSVSAGAADYRSMRCTHAAACSALATLLLLCSAATATALTDSPGGVQARVQVHPVVASLDVPRTATAGRPPRVTLRIDEPGVAVVAVQVAVTALASHRVVLTANAGWVRTGRTIAVAWPAKAALAAGGYELSVSAHDRRGDGLLRGAHSSGVASLTVTAPAPAAVKAPAPVTTPPSTSAPPMEAGVPSVAETMADGAVFPVAGPHNFGGPENVFGAPRNGYAHQGQDILTAEGTPVLAPLAGSILTTSYQEGGAGYYAVEQTAIGFDFMFAHCQAASLAVGTGAVVTAGEQLCRAGQTGDATAPHLDFEMWVGGWQAAGGRPINPLPYLEAWEG
jgi:hypothetical protein